MSTNWMCPHCGRVFDDINGPLCPSDDCPSQHEAKDVERLVRILAAHGHQMTAAQAVELWEAYSETYFAGWLTLPDTDEDVARLILPFVTQPKE